MEPEMSQGVDTPPPSGQDAGHTESVDSSAQAHTGEPRDARVTRALEPDGAMNGDSPPKVDRSVWLRDEDYWRKVTYISATGRRPGDRLATRPLPRPDRFPASSPLRSAAILALVIALIILIPVGVVIAGNAAAHFTIPTSIPGLTPATVTPTSVPTHVPTATPRKKK